MELNHTFTVPTQVDDAWALFMDLERVGGCFPGATVTEVTDNGFSGTVKVKLGPIALVYAGSGSFVERDDAAHRAVIDAKGKDKRGNGTAGAKVSIQLTPDGTGTRADVTTDLAVTGKPAQFGRGVMQDVSDKLLQAFVACIEQQLTNSSAPSPDISSATTNSSAPSISGSPALDDSRATPPGDSSDTHKARHPGVGQRSGAAVEDDALDLGSAVMPVLIQRYAGLGAAALVGLVIGWLVGRSRSSD